MSVKTDVRDVSAIAEQYLGQAQPHIVSGSPTAPARRLSLPLPHGLPGGLVWDGIETQARPLAFWPVPSGRGAPRRVLLTACGDMPDLPGLVKGRPARGAFTGPTATTRIVDHRHDSCTPWEIHELELRGADGVLGIRLGLLTDEGIHWWQWVTLEVVDEGPVSRTIRALGIIPVHLERHEVDGKTRWGRPRTMAQYPWLHRHNHVRGEVLARCYANGVVELSLRHVNGRFFSGGGDLKGTVPVIGFNGVNGDWPEHETRVTERRRWQWDGVALDLADAAHLVSEFNPGRAWRDDGMCLYQPYEGVEADAGAPATGRVGDSYLCRAHQRVIPNGMARTARMVASLGAVEPETAVYVMPDWWYGLCQDLCEEPLLPVRDHCAGRVNEAMAFYRENRYADCFDDGAVTRTTYPGEPGWEGETPHAQFTAAYLSGDPADYDAALRSAYHVADVAVDHAMFAIRMHGYIPPAQSLPMQRTAGLVAAYLETGDPYLLDTARSVSETAYWWDRQAWPRRSYGSDAAYIRGLIFLYRYLGERHYLDRAREALGRLISTQLPDGSFTDQGNTIGIHASPNLIVRPWMGCIATEAMVDYLAFEEDKEIAEAALRFAQWLLDGRFEDEQGRYWVYQQSYAGKDFEYELDGTPKKLARLPWHVEYLAKIMGWATMHTGDPAFYEAWRESYLRDDGHPRLWDHGCNKVVTNLTAQRALMWNVRLTPEGIAAAPRTDLAADLDTATVSTPNGPVTVDRDGGIA
jgi:hypothetical protein